MQILLTGAAGFIGSCLLKALNNEGWNDIIISDDFGRKEKKNNYDSKKFSHIIDRFELLHKLSGDSLKPDIVVHIGARTDTTEFNEEIFNTLNFNYSQKIWDFCTRHQIPLLYASSAATYGSGNQGYDDDESRIPLLKPLNPYGWSKQHFDVWALGQEKTPPHWYGFKFFNVYGPNEYHKGRMASVVYHGFKQINEKGKLRLFRSHRPDIPDGHQKRDFIYVMDVIRVLVHFMKTLPPSGIYNLGAGTARTFLDLALNVFKSMQLPPEIEWVDTPEDIRSTYQYYTCAPMNKLHQKGGYSHPFHSLEEGINDYVTQYLLSNRFF